MLKTTNLSSIKCIPISSMNNKILEYTIDGAFSAISRCTVNWAIIFSHLFWFLRRSIPEERSKPSFYLRNMKSIWTFFYHHWAQFTFCWSITLEIFAWKKNSEAKINILRGEKFLLVPQSFNEEEFFIVFSNITVTVIIFFHLLTWRFMQFWRR